MSAKRFLITGATGATGGKTIELLLERGHHVRAFVHKHDERSAPLEKQGVEIAVGDLLDFTTIRPALEDVWGAYFVYPIAPGLIEATAYFAQAAKEAKVPAIVNMSQISARREAKSHAAFKRKMPLSQQRDGLSVRSGNSLRWRLTTLLPTFVKR